MPNGECLWAWLLQLDTQKDGNAFTEKEQGKQQFTKPLGNYNQLTQLQEVPTHWACIPHDVSYQMKYNKKQQY